MLSEVNIEPFQTPFLYMPGGREKERKKKRDRQTERNFAPFLKSWYCWMKCDKIFVRAHF